MLERCLDLQETCDGLRAQLAATTELAAVRATKGLPAEKQSADPVNEQV